MLNNLAKGLDTIRVQKAELLEILRSNLIKHQEEYEIALSGYRVDCVDQLKAAMKTAKKNQSPNNISFIEPVCHSKEYSTMIEMLEMSIDTELEITHQEFTKYVKDEWSWKNAFNATSALYSGKA